MSQHPYNAKSKKGSCLLYLGLFTIKVWKNSDGMQMKFTPHSISSLYIVKYCPRYQKLGYFLNCVFKGLPWSGFILGGGGRGCFHPPPPGNWLSLPLQGGAWGAQAPPPSQPKQHAGFNGYMAEQPALAPPSSQEILICHVY